MSVHAFHDSCSSVQELIANSFLRDADLEHVLIIEDQAFIGMLIEDYLRALGYSSFAFALSVEEAVSSAREKCPGLITADVQLSPGCGIDAVQQICQSKPIPVLYITGTADLVRERCPGAAMISKPFGFANFLSGVRAAYAVSDRAQPDVGSSAFLDAGSTMKAVAPSGVV